MSDLNDKPGTSIFSTTKNYLVDILSGFHSACGSFMTALPYLFGKGDLRKEVTEQYPDPISSKTADDLPPRSRGLLFNDIDRCTGCKSCQKICPTDCIQIEVDQRPDSAKVWVSVFDIDFSNCVFCGLCVEVCQPQSITHTRNYERAAYGPKELVASFGRGKITPEQKAKWAAQRERNGEEGIMSP
ncbi:MAG: 4Fe-4S binding protein [Oligoflexia bacterium]|nr:4Fe-4S binding protein [Oligoflexia bacterium]